MNTIIKVEKQWFSAGISTCGRQNGVQKLRRLHCKWKSLQKARNRKNSPAQMKNRSRFEKKGE